MFLFVKRIMFAYFLVYDLWTSDNKVCYILWCCCDQRMWCCWKPSFDSWVKYCYEYWARINCTNNIISIMSKSGPRICFGFGNIICTTFEKSSKNWFWKFVFDFSFYSLQQFFKDDQNNAQQNTNKVKRKYAK